jgi:hypothetical protein
MREKQSIFLNDKTILASLDGGCEFFLNKIKFKKSIYNSNFVGKKLA